MITRLIAWVQASAVWIGICAALVVLAWLHGCSVGIDKERQRNAVNEAKAIGKAREADADAADAVATTKDKTDEQNERARHAAEHSDDPLADAMRELRR